MSLQVENLTLSIANKILCKQLSVSFKRGEFWGVMGINGVGKSTFLRSLIGLHEVEQGSVFLDNKNIQAYSRLKLAQLMGMMHQEYDYNFPSTVLEAALIGRHPFIKHWQWENAQDNDLAYKALQQVALEQFSERMLNTLSGGEKRRLNLATLLTQNPDYYLLDEPVNNLDIKAQLDILSLLKKRFMQGIHCGIMVIHDPNQAYRYCDHILMLFNNGQYLSGKTRDIVTKKNLSRLYNCPIHQVDDAQQTLFIPLENAY